MRFAERARRLSLYMAMAAAVVAVAVAAGCASPSYEPQPLPEASASDAASLAAAKAASLGPRPAPAVQKAFDDAVRALRAGQSAQAEKAFRALAQAYPELPGPHANLGLILRQSGKLPESARELERAASLGAAQPVYLTELGITYRHLGQFEKARLTYDKAIALDAKHAPAILNLGILYDLYLGNPTAAMTQYERYLTLTPGGDATVTKWVAELKNRKPAAAAVPAAPGKDKS